MYNFYFINGEDQLSYENLQKSKWNFVCVLPNFTHNIPMR